MTEVTVPGCCPLGWELSWGQYFTGFWHLFALPTPLFQGRQSRELCGAFRLRFFFFLGFPSIYGKDFSDSGSKFPSVKNLEISKFPLFILCLFWKIWEMSTDRYMAVFWRMFLKDCKTESQWKSNCKQALIFRLCARPDQTKQAENKQRHQVKRPSQQPHLNCSSITETRGSITSQKSKLNFKPLTDLKSWYCSLSRNWTNPSNLTL